MREVNWFAKMVPFWDRLEQGSLSDAYNEYSLAEDNICSQIRGEGNNRWCGDISQSCGEVKPHRGRLLERILLCEILHHDVTKMK